MSGTAEDRGPPGLEYAFQPDFSAGELSPSLWFRQDLQKEHSGAALMRNFYLQVQGNIARRPGTAFVGATHDGVGPWRLVRFQFSQAQQYVLEFGPGYIAILYQGAYLMVDEANRYLVATPYAGGALPSLRFTQSADVLTIAHPQYQPMTLSRYGTTDWRLQPFVTGTKLPQVTGLGIAANGGSGFGDTTAPNGSLQFTYAVTAVSVSPPDEGPLSQPVTVENYDLGYYSEYGVSNTIKWKAIPNSGKYTYNVYRLYQGVWAFVGSTAATQFQDIDYSPNVNITPGTGTDPFAIDPIESITIQTAGTGYTANAYATVSDPTGSGAEVTIATDGSGVIAATVRSGGAGYTNPTITVSDPGISNNGTQVAGGSGATLSAVVDTAQNFPGAVGYFQERLVFGGSGPAPETIWTSRSGNYTSFRTSTPPVGDDAIEFTLAARQINAIRHFVPLADLLVFTSGGGWKVDGSQPVMPSNFSVAPQSFTGCSDLEPIVIGLFVLFVEARGATVRELRYDLYTSSYITEDKTVLSAHLLYGHQIVSWAYSDSAKVIWMVRDDGVLLSLTYLREQNIYAWAQHAMGGASVYCVEVVTEPVGAGYEDIPYFVIRPTDGTAPCVVRQSTHLLGPQNTDPAQAWYVGRGVRYEGTPTTTLIGLGHLEGQTVAVLADGNPMTAVVRGGQITLGAQYSVIVAGVPYVSTVTTLPLATPRAIPGAHKRIAQVRASVFNTAGLTLAVGAEPPAPFFGLAGDDPNFQPDATTAELLAGIQELQADGGWDRLGQVTLSASGPQPAFVNGVAMAYEVGT